LSRFASAQTEADRGHGALLLQKQPVRILLRGNRSLDGTMHIPEGQSLAAFLGMKSYFLNLTDVRWLDGRPEEERIDHLCIRISQIVWVVPLDGALSLSSAASPFGESRQVELDLVGNVTLRVTLSIAAEQRMSDYFDSNTSFVPLRSAQVLRTQEVIERLAVSHEAILTIREL